MSRIQELMRDRRAQGIAVVVGALVLLVVAGVLAISLLGAPRAVGESSPSPSPSAPAPTESSSPRPSASNADASPSPSPPPMALDRPFAATSLVNDLRIRALPGDGAPVGELDAGDVVLVQGETEELDGIDWYSVTASGTDEPTSGWVSAGPADDPYLELHWTLAHMVPATVDGMAGGEAGYLAWGFNARESTEQPTRFVAVSADGSSWQLSEAPGAVNTAGSVFAAHGPSGWLLVTRSPDPSATGELWRSSDGLAWEQGTLSLPDEVMPDALAGYDGGYALAAIDDRSQPSQAALFISRDGDEWEELTGDPFPYGFALDGLDNGFIASGEIPSERFVVRTADVQGWTSPEDRGLPGTSPRVVTVGNSVIAIAMAPQLGPMHAWRSTLDLDGWERQPELEAILEKIGVSYLVASDEWILLAGKAYSDGGDQWWRSADGLAWEPISPVGVILADLHGPMAAGPGGFNGVASERTEAGSNPQFVVSPDARGWTSATDSAVPVLASAVVGSCPAAPDTMIDWMAIPGAVGAECIGSSPVTFAAWSTQGGGCGGFAPGRFEPAWLASPFAYYPLILTPMEVPYGGCGSAAGAPGTEMPEQLQWVEVTGHWDDPAAAECHWIPQPELPWSGPGSDLVASCREKFVATSVTPTSAP